MAFVRRLFTSANQISLAFVAVPMLLLVLSTPVLAQSSEGDADLDQAFSLKLSAKSVRDLDKVVALCESAIEKGLDEENTEQAQQLAASALYEHADQLSKKIFATSGRDRRWQLYRRQALNRLDKAVKLDPKMGPAWLLITKLHQLPSGDKTRAAVAIEKAIELAGDDRRTLSSALYLRAQLSQGSADEETLLADLEQAIKIDPDNVDAYRLRGEYYLRKREPEKALGDLNRWLESNENALAAVVIVEYLITMGDKFDESLQAEALKILDRAIEKDPKNSNAYDAKARVHAIQKKNTDALKAIEKALEIDPSNDRYRRFQVQLLIDEKRYEDALVLIDEALEKNQNDLGMMQLRMSLLIDQANFTDAIVQLKRLIRKAPSNSQLRLQLARLYNANDQPTKAIKIYDTLLDGIPATTLADASDEQRTEILYSRADLLQGRGGARLSIGDHAGAISDYEEALDLSYQLRDLEEELDTEQSLDWKNGTLIGVLNNFAWVLATSPEDELRDGKRAIELATEAGELTEFKEAYILSTLASGYAEAGDFENAHKWIDKAIEANAKQAEELDADEDPELAERNAEQSESLRDEKASYEEEKAWREKQNVEAEKADKEADEEAADDQSADEKDSDDSAPDDADQPDSTDKKATPDEATEPGDEPQTESTPTEPEAEADDKDSKPEAEAKPEDVPETEPQPEPVEDPNKVEFSSTR